MKELTARLRAIAWRLAWADFTYALNPAMIADMLGVQPHIALRARNSAEYSQYTEELRQEWLKRAGNEFQADIERLKTGLGALVPRALQVLSQALDDEKPDIRLRAAQEVIDRDGNFPKVSKVQTVSDKPVLPDVDGEIVNEFHKHLVQ